MKLSVKKELRDNMGIPDKSEPEQLMYGKEWEPTWRKEIKFLK